MSRLILTLVALSAAFIKINAQCSVSGNCPPPDMKCMVGESDLAKGGFCNEPNGDAACSDYCKKTFGAELIGASCSAERANKQKECICQLKCQNGGCWGDPHCWTWDGSLFSYQSLKKYYLFKPKKSTPLIPKFEVIQSNHPWQGSAATTLDTLNFIINDWAQNVQVVAPVNKPLVVTLNGKAQAVPGRWSEVKGCRENYIDFKYSDAAHLLISTSFGVVVMVHNDGAYSDVSINIPRHAEFKGNTWGLLSSWNDNKADDNLDANGKPQSLTEPDCAAFGNSFLIPGEKMPTQAELDEDKKHHEDHVKAFNKEHWEHLIKMCKSNLDHGEMKHCMQQLGRPSILVEDCAYDLSHIIQEADQHKFLKAKVEHYKQQCKHHQMEYTHHKRPEHIKNHEPIPCPEHRRKFHEERERRRNRRPDGGYEPEDEGRGRRPHHGGEGPEDEGRRGRPHHGGEGPEDDRRGGRPHQHGGRGGPEDGEEPTIIVENGIPPGTYVLQPHRGGRGPGGRGRGHPFLPHHKFGPSKPEHKDKCGKAKEVVKKEAVQLIECLKFEGWFEEEN